MALPTRPATSWFSGIDLPNQFVERSGDDYELYEEDGEFVLSIELPGFDPGEVSVSWDDGLLYVSGQHEDETRDRRRTYHRRFRFPKRVHEEEIEATYTNGVLEVTLPVAQDLDAPGTEIEVQT